MSISYHGIIGFGSGKTTLPSVETWGSNMNILRDPPKAIFTRKIDRVGQTSEITEMIDESGSRACEAILTYARGVNPMVSVSYDNYGNNGGQKSGSINQQGFNVNGGSSKQAYLPYRIMDRGAFRPPVKDQRDSLPLSRQPRIWTSSFSKKGFTDFSKKVFCPSETGSEYRAIKDKDDMIKTCIRPTATYQLETPIIENYEVKYVIKNPVKVSGFSGLQPVFKTNGEIGDPTKIKKDPLRTDININKKAERNKNIELSHFSTDKYTQETLHSDVNANLNRNINALDINESHGIDTYNYTQETLHSDVNANLNRNINALSIEEAYNINTDNKIKNFFNINYDTPQSGYEKVEYIHNDIDLQRVLPYYESKTNKRYNIHKNLENQITERTYNQNRPSTNISTNIGGGYRKDIDNISSREYNLKPTVNAGGFNPVPTMPLVYHENSIQEFDNQKMKMRKNIYEMQQDRNISIGNIPYNNI